MVFVFKSKCSVNIAVFEFVSSVYIVKSLFGPDGFRAEHFDRSFPQCYIHFCS